MFYILVLILCTQVPKFYNNSIHTSMQADVVHQPNAGCEYLVAMWAFQLLAPSLQMDSNVIKG